MFKNNKVKIVDILFKQRFIQLNNLKVEKIIFKRRDCEIIHYIDQVTGDNYIGKKFKPLTLLTVQKPGFYNNYGNSNDKFTRIKSEVLIASKFQNCNYINKLINSYILEASFPSQNKFYQIQPQRYVVLILMEKAQGDYQTELNNRIKEGQYWKEETLLQINLQLLKALSILQTQNIVHKDLKPRNFLKDYKGNAQLCDFGLSRDLTLKNYSNNGGTKMYMDPLRLKAWKKYKEIPKTCEFQCDAFSFGLSILEMGNLLTLKDISLNKQEKLLNQQLDIFGKRYPKIKEIIIPLLLWDESKRQTFQEILDSKIEQTETCSSTVLKKRKRRRKTQKKDKAFEFIGIEADQHQFMEKYNYLTIMHREDKKGIPYQVREILNVFKYRWDNYLSEGQLDDKYWDEAKKQGYVQRQRTAKSLKWCFINKRKLFRKDALKTLKLVQKFDEVQFFTDQKGIYCYIQFKNSIEKIYNLNEQKIIDLMKSTVFTPVKIHNI